MNLNSEEMIRLREIREGFAADLAKAEREMARAQTKLDSARTKLGVADEMIATLENNGSRVEGATFIGLGKYTNMPLSEAILDVVKTHAGLEGMSAKAITEILVNEGVRRKTNLGVAIFITAGRLAKRGLIKTEQTEHGKRFFKIVRSEDALLNTAA